jgi:SAM-dependent methyltransferase
MRLTRILEVLNMRQNGEKPYYGNWISKKLLFKPLIASLILLTLSFALPISVVRATLGVSAASSFSFFLYLLISRRAFSNWEDGTSARILDMVVGHVRWDGNGRALDIGCGSGALAIRIARRFRGAELDAIDTWGAKWDYRKEQCEKNALLEDVGDRICFLEASASCLPFPNECFDVVVSNFCFHEVKEESDKCQLILEALRVLKKGGMFVFHDLFFIEGYYGKQGVLLARLNELGLTELHLEKTSSLDFVPCFMRIPYMLGGIGILCGVK